jgi:hypothetical protein
MEQEQLQPYSQQADICPYSDINPFNAPHIHSKDSF